MLTDTDHETAELLFTAADQLGLQPNWVVPGGLFAISVGDSEEYINLSRSPLNTALSSSLARNKYFTRMVLERHGIRNIPFMRPKTDDMAAAFLAAHGKIIAKPLSGSGSRDIHIITRSSQLAGLDLRAYILEKYIAGTEVRYLILNESVVAVYESEYGGSVAQDRSLHCTSYAPAQWDDDLIAESMRIVKALHLRFAAVDYLIDSDGQYHVLEVNTMPDLKWFHSPSAGPSVNVAGRLLEALYVQNSTAP